jgi:hypothetical protein
MTLVSRVAPGASGPLVTRLDDVPQFKPRSEQRAPSRAAAVLIYWVVAALAGNIGYEGKFAGAYHSDRRVHSRSPASFLGLTRGFSRDFRHKDWGLIVRPPMATFANLLLIASLLTLAFILAARKGD